MTAAWTLALFAAVALPWLYVRDARRQRRERAALFSGSLQLFQNYRVTQQGADFPLLEGSYRGHRVKLEPILDTVAWRKIPSLWLKVTLFAPIPHSGVLDFLVRPGGVEFYSPSQELPTRVPIPAGWPQHAVLRTDDTKRMPPLACVTPLIGLFDDAKMKELLITPRGVRLVYQLWQAERADYLLLRQARFAHNRMESPLLKSLLESAIAVADAMCNAPAAAAMAVAPMSASRAA